METRMLFKPGPHFWRLVSPVVVDNEMQVEAFAHRAIDLTQEPQIFRRAMARLACADHEAGFHIERRERSIC